MKSKYLREQIVRRDLLYLKVLIACQHMLRDYSANMSIFWDEWPYDKVLYEIRLARQRSIVDQLTTTARSPGEQRIRRGNAWIHQDRRAHE